MDHSAIADRRQLRRKLTFWRVAAVLIALAAVFAISFGAGRVLVPQSFVDDRNTQSTVSDHGTEPKGDESGHR